MVLLVLLLLLLLLLLLFLVTRADLRGKVVAFMPHQRSLEVGGGVVVGVFVGVVGVVGVVVFPGN